MGKLYFATGNSGKADEAAKILDVPIEIVKLELEEIQSLDVKKVAEHKARQAFEKLGKPVFVDDVSFEVMAWNGFPGPFIKFISVAGGEELLLKMLKGEDDRRVKVTATIAYHDGKEIHIVEGSFMGTIVERRGKGGWGFDPFVIPEGQTKTFGEMDEELKNSVSHRYHALMNFKKLLNSQTR